MLLESILVLLEDLDIVVGEAQESHQDRRDDHQEDVDIVEPSEKERGDQDRHDDDDPTHRRGALLRLLPFETEVTDEFADLLALEEMDDAPPPDRADQQGKDDCHPYTEGDVSE